MKLFIILFAAFISFNSMAAIVCHTPRMNKNFEIKENKISFFQESNELKNRGLASLYSRNKSESKGITKIVEFENQKHTIHIEDINNFSDSEDYLLVRNKSGHEMTYPISCSKN